MTRIKGFTLIELMIVVAIIGILAMIGVPSYNRYVAKAKRAEAYMNLSSIYAAEKAYWAEHGTYSAQLNGPGGIGWDPQAATTNYTYGFGSSVVTGKLPGSSADMSQAYADQNGFLALAVADIDGDGQPDILAVDHNNNITILQDDLL